MVIASVYGIFHYLGFYIINNKICKKGGEFFILELYITSEEKISKTKHKKKLSVKVGKRNHKLITYLFRLIQSFL